MKKIISLLLVLIVCLSLFSCNNGNNNDNNNDNSNNDSETVQNPIVGEWISDNGVKAVFRDDGTCSLDDEMEMKWSYDEAVDIYTLYAEIPITISIKTENGIRYFDIWGITRYYHADDYKSNNNDSNQDPIVGEWLFDNGYTIIFNADHSGTMLAAEEYEIKWSYDETLDYYPCKMISGDASKIFEITYKIDDDGNMSIFAWGNKGIKQDNNTTDENTKSDEIIITTDNWQEYLELKLVEEWTANGYFLSCALCLRDEYADRKIAYTTVLEIEWSGTWVYRKYACDREAKTYEIGDIVADKPNEEVAERSTFLTQLLYLEHYANSKTVILLGGETDYNSYVKTIENFNVISASGTIRFE